MSARRRTGLASVVLVLAVTLAAHAASPADALLELAPPDAGATLVIEDLRSHVRTVLDSPLAEAFRQLPAVKSWLASDEFRKFATAREQIQNVLGVSPSTIRDEVFGEAAVLALHAPEGGRPDEARGLLLVKVRDRALLDRLIVTINSVEKRDGPLTDVLERKHRGQTYWVRNFREGTKPAECYTILGADVFAWSNSEALVRGAIDRRAGEPGLSGLAAFRTVREALPARSAVSLFVDPRFLERAAAAGPPRVPSKPSEVRLAAFLRRYLSAVSYAGAALEWREGFVLHVHEVLDPAKVDEPLRRWAAHAGDTAGMRRRVPSSALAVAAVHWDGRAIFDLLLSLVPESEQAKITNVTVVLRGLLLDKEPREEVFAYLGPGAVGFLDTPPREKGPDARPPLVVAIEISGGARGSGVAAALENALRTVLALSTLDAKAPEASQLRLETRDVGSIRVTSLLGRKAPFCYAVTPECITFGNDAQAVASFAAGPKGEAEPAFERVRSEFFPNAQSFAYADLEALCRLAAKQRAALARRLVDGRDLDEAIALLGLFRTGFFTSTVGEDFSWTHRTLGLLARTKLAP
jgi:hypothetical protein